MTGERLTRTPLTDRLAGFGTTIFAEMSALAVKTGSINLGQGFPDTDGPQAVLDAAVEAIRSGVNQYPPGPGIPALRQAIAEHQRRFYGLDVDPDGEVLVTAGATEALAGALLGMLDAGDEVVVFEPMYDSYQACIALADAIARPVVLRPGVGPNGQYGFDRDELRAAFSARTKLVLVNTPHNPTGKVFTRDELAFIGELAQEFDAIVVTDEVYEHLVFSGAEHVPMATLPGMADRTLTISSGGKTFNTTGWKIGWVCGPAALVDATKTAKQFLTYVNGAPFQPAIAVGLGLPDQFFTDLAADLEAKRDHLFAGLVAAGFTAYRPEATYFTTVDIRPVAPDGDGFAFCRAMPERIGVVAIPNQVFYANQEHGRHLVRFACCKRLEVIDAAVERLAQLSESVGVSELRLAAVQHDIAWNDRDANFDRLAPKIAGAVACGAQLVLLTETFSTGFGFGSPGFESEITGGPSSQFLAEQAKEHGVWVGGSCAEIHPDAPDDDPRPSNCFVLAGPDGTQHRYRKIHPFSHAGEERFVRPGTELVTVDVEGFRVSMLVCYDLRFADEFWQLAADTDLYLVPANWPEKRREHWMTLLAARAIENQAYVVGVNRVGAAGGEGGTLTYSGDSRIVDPTGELLATASRSESILLADIATDRVEEIRDHFRFLPDRR